MFRRRVQAEDQSAVDRGDIEAIMISLMRIDESLARIQGILEEENDGEEEEEDP